MDELDTILIDAWNRVSQRVRQKRVMALRRSRRRFRGVLTRPMREWCLVIRASDTRINDSRAIIDPTHAIERQEPNTVTLDGTLIRELTRPVSIAWPGVTYAKAAIACGREYKTIKAWVRHGVFRVEHYREFRFPEHARRSKGNAHRGGFGGRPYVWTPSPIDPNNFTGRAPHSVWGTVWQNLWKKLPEDYVLTVRREPYVRCKGRNRRVGFSGWHFICPGRVDQDGNYKGCGRRCTYLYGPQTVWTLPVALGFYGADGEGGFAMPSAAECRPKGLQSEPLRLAGEWYPGLNDPILSTGPRSFACKTCWNVRSACMANRTGWNEFVAQLSGGLLYGRDVPRPMDICPIARKKRPYQWKTSARRAPPSCSSTGSSSISTSSACTAVRAPTR